MTKNLLKQNDDNTNIICLASPNCVKSLRTPALQMGAYSIIPNGSVKTLGVIIYIDVCVCTRVCL